MIPRPELLKILKHFENKELDIQDCCIEIERICDDHPDLHKDI